MKKFLYLGLTGLMVLSSTTRCMDELIRADQEAQEPAPISMLEEGKVHGPQLPAKEELVKTFFQAAVIVASKKRSEVASSEPFAVVKSSYETLKAMNQGDKDQTRAELFDGYCSDDENYYENGLADEKNTEQKVESIKAILALKIQPKIKDNKEEAEQLKHDKESIDNALKALYLKRAANAEATAKNAQAGELLAKVNAMHNSSKEQENSLLKSRANELMIELKEIDERIATYKDESIIALDADVSKSVIAAAIKVQVDTEESLLKVKATLQAKLNKINAVIERLNATPKQGWFSNWLAK